MRDLKKAQKQVERDTKRITKAEETRLEKELAKALEDEYDPLKEMDRKVNSSKNK